MAFFDLDDLMGFEEQFVSYIVQTTLAAAAAELELLERDLTALENVSRPSRASATTRRLSASTPSAKRPTTRS
jgi:aspartyl/asparaginyl-tRNA synthetase